MSLEKNKELVNAVERGDVEDINRLIREGAYVNFKDIWEDTPLHVAARAGSEPIVSLLLSHGSLINEMNRYGKTPLHLAVLNCHESVVSTLLRNNAKVNEKTENGWTPLHLAARFGHEPVVSTLLRNNAKVNEKTYREGDTPLHEAVIAGKEPIVSLLLSHGSLINERNRYGETPLHGAVRVGNEPITSLLLRNGSLMNEKDNQGKTPLHIAASAGREPIISLLLSHGSQINEKNTVENTPLHIAASAGREPIISLLLSHGSLINEKNTDGDTPLHLAAVSGSMSVTVILLKSGAIMMEKNRQGKTPMDHAEEYNNRAISKLFKKILSSGLPKELFYLSTDDGATFSSNLRSGFYLSYVGKIMCVGSEAVGKTAITSVLRDKTPSKNRTSTEGLDLHIYRAAVDMEMKKWVTKGLDVEDVAFRDLLNEQNVAVQTLDIITEEDNNDDTDDDNNDLNGACSDIHDTEQCDEPSPNFEQSEESLKDTRSGRRGNSYMTGNTQNRKSLFQMIKHKLGLEKAELHTIEDIQKEAVRRGKKGLLNSSLAPINMMDFGGQTAFYSTHQSFLTYRGIYLLVIDGSKGFDDKLETELFIPGLCEIPTSRNFTLFWVSSIEWYSKGGSDMFPKILVVCTHRDKVGKDEADQRIKEIFNGIETMFKGTTAMNHLVLEPRIFLNAKDPSDPGYDMLKDVLVELLCTQPSWGEKVPKSWIYLKMMINRSVEKGVTIMSMKTLRSINEDNPVQVLSEKDLQLFLRIQHSQGEIIHFQLSGLRDNIIISPKFLVDALRSLITDEHFCKGHRRETIESMNRDGLLQCKDIATIWNGKKQFIQHMEYLVKLMEHLDILATPRHYDKSGKFVKQDFYYVPSLVKTTDESKYLEASNSKSLGLSFRFHSKILPPVIGYRLIASCVDMFEVKKHGTQLMLFSGMVVVSVKKDLDLAVVLRSNRVDVFLIHQSSKFEIVRDTASGIAECLNDILMTILENKRVISSEGSNTSKIPFHTEFMCSNILSPCYNEGKENWTCLHENKVESIQEVRVKWSVDRTIESCKTDCEGLSETDLNERPSELQLAKLALQFKWEDLYQLVIQLGSKVTDIEAFKADYSDNHRNVALLCLRRWKLKTNGTVGDLIKAIEDMQLDVHAACKMIRNKPVSIPEYILMTEPTDKLIDSISSEAITESLLLSIHLGHKAALWLGMKEDKEKIININRNMLQRWKSDHPKNDQMRDLAQALCNVGLNITSFDI